jgi:pimeloyl-ACP methyl ester carboxylesterase
LKTIGLIEQRMISILHFSKLTVLGACALVLTTLCAVNVDGVNIHFSVTRTGSKTVILVHGYTCDETTWKEQVPALAKSYRVVTLDLPGHGKSDPPKDGKLSMDLFARAIEAVRVEVKAERVVAVGHSMGTPGVLRYAHLYPEHVWALVFVDGLMPLPSTQAAARANQGATMGGPNGRAAREAMIRRFFVAGTTPDVQTKVLNMMLGAPEATAVGAVNATREPAGQTTEIPMVPILGLYAVLQASPARRRYTLLFRASSTPRFRGRVIS